MQSVLSEEALPKGYVPNHSATRAAREDAHKRWSKLPVDPKTPVSFEKLLASWESINQVAEKLSGTTKDAMKRAVVYYSIFEDSDGNFMFPLAATHGSLWGVTHTIWAEKWLHRLAPVIGQASADRYIESLDQVRDINRKVFVEVYTTFYFTRYYGDHPKAKEIVNSDVLAAFNQVHAAVRSGNKLSREERRDIYYTVFTHEQTNIVDPGIKKAVAHCDNWPIVRTMSVVRPQFKYFPKGRHLNFTDFTSVEQRNREGLRALAFAEEVGPERVLEAMGEYGI